MKPLLLALALAILFFAMLHVPTPTTLRLIMAWLCIFATGIFWHGSPLRGGDLVHWGSCARAACLHLLGLIAALQLLDIAPRHFPLALLASWSLPLAWTARRRRESVPGSEGIALFAVLALALALWMWRNAPDIDLNSDAPAHLGAIVDAARQERWRPLDVSAPGLEGLYDPRFGVWHGLYAAMAEALQLSPAFVLRYSPIVLAPLWFLAHALLFRLWLPRASAAVLVALLFTLGGADGRGFGSTSASYPASVSMALAALALASIYGGDLRSPRWWRGDAILLGASACIHPLGWWISLLLIAHAILLQRLFGARAWSRPQLRAFVVALVVGLLALWPTLAQRGASAGGPHAIPLNVVFFGPHLFVCDPLRVLRWGGGLSLLLLPLSLGVGRRYFGGERHSLLAAGLLCVWTVAMNPFLQPWVYSLVGYLSERLGRVAYPEVLGALLLARPWADRFRVRRRGARPALFAIGLMGAFLLARSGGQSWRALHLDATPNPEWVRSREIAAGLAGLAPQSLLTDPRLSYGLRAWRGGRVALYPLAHASPLDRELPARLAAFRDLLDPSADEALLQGALAELGPELLLLRSGVEADPSEGNFGFEADDMRLRTLLERLRAGGSVPLRQGEDWWLFEVDELRFAAAQAWAAPCTVGAAQPLLAAGSRFDVIAVHAPSSVSAGDTLLFEIHYRAHDERQLSLHPEWERVHLRLSGEMPRLPDWLTPIGKPIRKLLLERSGRSDTRFGGGYVPFDGYHPPARWPGGLACETVRLPVPARMPAGQYSLQITVQETTWQPRLDWRDYLSDRDRFSAPAAAQVEIQATPRPTGQGAELGV